MKVKSKKPGKKRKLLYKVKNHQKSKLFMVRLDENLQMEWGIRRLPLRKDDEVRIIRGEMVNVEGKVLNFNYRTRKIEIEEATMEKKNGATYYVPISPSNVVLVKLGGKKLDPRREKIINRKEKLAVSEEVTSAPKKGGK